MDSAAMHSFREATKQVEKFDSHPHDNSCVGLVHRPRPYIGLPVVNGGIRGPDTKLSTAREESERCIFGNK